MNLPDKIISLHKTLQEAEISHAFGGALALAWCTRQARGTIDIDLNIFLDTEHVERGLNALPDDILWSKVELEEAKREGQVRLMWGNTPVDIFLNTLKLHQEMSRRIRWEVLMNESIPFLACNDLAVFKVFFNRTKDWADLEAMLEAGTVNIPQITATIIEYLGVDDERVTNLSNLSIKTASGSGKALD
jgi:hypothetical protein